MREVNGTEYGTKEIVAAWTLAGMAAGPAIGGTYGTAIFPGGGTFVGAFIGAIPGVVVGFLDGLLLAWIRPAPTDVPLAAQAATELVLLPLQIWLWFVIHSVAFLPLVVAPSVVSIAVAALLGRAGAAVRAVNVTARSRPGGGRSRSGTAGFPPSGGRNSMTLPSPRRPWPAGPATGYGMPTGGAWYSRSSSTPKNSGMPSSASPSCGLPSLPSPIRSAACSSTAGAARAARGRARPPRRAPARRACPDRKAGR
jgi:hypothetical protein